jgi:hypothetical protein
MVEQYNRRVLYTMLIKSYNHVHLVGDGAYGSID